VKESNLSAKCTLNQFSSGSFHKRFPEGDEFAVQPNEAWPFFFSDFIILTLQQLGNDPM
jgi:hypothetical protein